MKKIQIPISAEYHADSFAQCGAIECITFTSGNGEVFELGSDWFFSENVYYIARTSNALREIVFEEGITYIPSNIARNCVSLRTVHLPATLQSIGKEAFSGCTGLTGVEFLGNAPATIGKNSFNTGGKPTLYRYASTSGWEESQHFDKSKDTWCGHALKIISADHPLYRISVNDREEGTVFLNRTIGVQGECVELVAMPSLGYKFSGFLLDDELIEGRSFVIGGNHTVGASFDCYKEGVAVGICGGEKEWSGCNLSWQLYSDGELAITGYGRMQDCIYEETPWREYNDQILYATIHPGALDIGDSTFYNCHKLTGVTIPDSVTSIGSHVFFGCSNLSAITIPDSVTYLGETSFYCCTSLTSIVIPDGVPYIGLCTFDGCTALASVTLPASVDTISDYAFANCTSLVSIEIPDSVTSIGREAFFSCSSLPAIRIPDSVEWIGSDAFKFCSNLTSVIIPEKVTWISWGMFEECTALASVVIKNGALGIGEGAFKNCVSLTSVEFLGNEPADVSSGEFTDCSSELTIYYHGGTTGWLESERYDAEANTWCGYPLVMLMGKGDANILERDSHSARLCVTSGWAGQAVVGFYNVDGQMLSAQVFDMPVGETQLTVTEEKLDLTAVVWRVFFLDKKGQPLYLPVKL